MHAINWPKTKIGSYLILSFSVIIRAGIIIELHFEKVNRLSFSFFSKYFLPGSTSLEAVFMNAEISTDAGFLALNSGMDV